MVITAETKRAIAEVARKHGLKLVVLFGSHATGHTHRKSDVDIGYISPRNIDYRESHEITQALVRLFKNPEVELVNLDRTSPDFKKQVADHAVVLFDEAGTVFDMFSIHANRIYMETKPLRAYRDRYVKEFLASYAK